MTKKEYRKTRRNNLYYDAINLMNREGFSLGWAMKIVKGKAYLNGPWEDPDSPTGWSQVCDYVGTCQHPCNGDC